MVGKSKLSCLRSRCCGIGDPYILNEDLVGSCDDEDVAASMLFNPCVHCACVLFQKVGYSILTCSSYVVNFSNICTISASLSFIFHS